MLLMTLIFTSCGDGSSGRNVQIAGVQGPTVTLLGQDVLIAFVFENVQLQGGLRYAIPVAIQQYGPFSSNFMKSLVIFHW